MTSLRSLFVGKLCLLALTVFFTAAINAQCSQIGDEFYDQRNEEFRLTYALVYKAALSGVYLIGKPAGNVLQRVGGSFVDLGSGLVHGGPKGAIANVILKQGIDAGLRYLHDYLESPQSIANQIALSAMSMGYDAYLENYDLLTKDWRGLSNDDKLLFFNNQNRVDLMAIAKELYITSNRDIGAHYPNAQELEALSTIESALTSQNNLEGILTAAKVIKVLEDSKISWKDYSPMVDFLSEAEQIRSTNSNLACGALRNEPFEKNLDTLTLGEWTYLINLDPGFGECGMTSNLGIDPGFDNKYKIIDMNLTCKFSEMPQREASAYEEELNFEIFDIQKFRNTNASFYVLNLSYLSIRAFPYSMIYVVKDSGGEGLLLMYGSHISSEEMPEYLNLNL